MYPSGKKIVNFPSLREEKLKGVVCYASEINDLTVVSNCSNVEITAVFGVFLQRLYTFLASTNYKYYICALKKNTT